MTQIPASGKKRLAQIKTERRGMLYMCAIITLTCLPALLWIFAGDTFDMPPTSPAIFFVWIFNFWLFGPKRMLNGGILLFSKSAGPVATDEQIEQLALGLAFEKNLSSPQTFCVGTELNSAAQLKAYFKGKDGKRLYLDSLTCDAILDLMTGDGDIYRLTVASGRSYTISWSEEEMSAHERIAASGVVQKKRTEAKLLRA